MLLILHTYFFYPLVMLTFFSNYKGKRKEFSSIEQDLPNLAILIAAYNEEKIIGEKIKSIFNTDYPSEKIRVYVGSDASEDATESVVEKLKEKYKNLELIKFKSRVGKINIVNHLQSLGDEDILVLTDANVLFKTNTLFELIKYFKDEKVGIVAANIIKESLNMAGISRQEIVYLSMENRIKAAESNALNLIMGAEGGCYAIRNNLFSKVPSKFIVDDFYITFQVLIKGKYALFNPNALCSEDVPSEVRGEYRRKVRISSGNFQNLFFFKQIAFKFWRPMGFSFISHKVLRWLTPFFLIFSLITSAFLAGNSQFFSFILFLQILGFLFPLLNHFFRFENSLLRFISHFYFMNFALLHGFVKFSKGIKTSIWQPVKRNV